MKAAVTIKNEAYLLKEANFTKRMYNEANVAHSQILRNIEHGGPWSWASTDKHIDDLKQFKDAQTQLTEKMNTFSQQFVVMAYKDVKEQYTNHLPDLEEDLRQFPNLKENIAAVQKVNKRMLERHKAECKLTSGS